MRKATSNILIGLACTSILSLSAGVQTVKADVQEPVKQSQVSNDKMQEFKVEENSDFFSYFSANNLVNGYISNKTTKLEFLFDNTHYGIYAIRDSNNHLVKEFYFVGTTSATVDLQNSLKGGETYSITNIENLDKILSFKVVSKDTISIPAINKVTSQDTSISGTGVAGATVNLTIAGDTYIGTVDASGNYVISLSKTYAVNSAITVTQEKDGVTSDPATAKVVAPEQLGLPTVNKVTDQDTSISGTGVAGATVNLTIAGDTYIGTVDASGNYVISLSKTYAVNSAITVTQEKDGVTSDPATAKVVAPEQLGLPTVNKVTDQDTSISGTGVAGATVNLTIAGDTYIGTVDASGNYVISLSKTYAVNSAITVTQEKDGITSDPATAKVVAPEQLGLPTLNTVTDQDTIVTGTAAAGATVHLSVNGFNFQTTASANGDFSINIEKNYPANTPIEVYQELNGIKSQTAEFYVQLTSDFIINKIKSNATSITGTGHPNAQITVQIHDEVFTGTIDGSGNFNINLQGATFKVGTDVKITSVSSEGTETKTVQIYPRDPVIGVIFVADDEIRGTADPGATVIITVGSTQYQTTADSNGNFRQSVNPNLVVSEAVVTVYSTINGYESEKESKTVS